MHKEPFPLLGWALVAISSTPVLAAAPPADQQWQCEAAADGGWACAATAKPQGPFAQAGRPFRQASARPAPGAEPAADALTNTLDWVPRNQLSDAASAALPMQCSGTYVEPPLEAPSGEATVFGTVHASSAESEMSQNPTVARFSGNVTVRQDDRRLRADRATFYRDEDRIEIEGNVQYREPDLLVRSDTATVRTNDQSGELHNARFVMHSEHKRGEAEQVNRNADGTLDFKNGSVTECAPGDESWLLVGENIHIDRAAGQGTMRNARLEIRGVPVAYSPYLRFPTDDRRMSGLLWPSFTNSSQSGLDLSAPYYFNLAPNYDATLAPRYIDRRGAMASGEFRYLNDWSNWTVSGAFLPDDNVYGDSRWLTGLQHQGHIDGHWFTRVDYTEVSDDDYLHNLSATGLEIKRAAHLPQIASVAYSFDGNWLVQATTQQYQLLDPELQHPYKMLPRIELSRAFTGAAFQPDYALHVEYTAFDHQDRTELTGQRMYVEPMLSYPMQWSAGFVRPTVGYQAIKYNLDQNPTINGTDSPSVGAPMVAVDSGVFFERESTLFDGDYVQTLEPRMHYLWVDHDDHSDVPNFDSSDLTFSFNQLFRNTRFSGHDRIADANQASLSVTSRLIEDSGGHELMTASIGQIFYFDDRRVSALSCVQSTYSAQGAGNPDCQSGAESDSTSELAAELQIQPTRNLHVTGSALWDNGRAQLDQGGVMVHWTPNTNTIVNAGYRYRRDQLFIDQLGNSYVQNIDQADFSVALPLGEHWKLLARYEYDFVNDNSLEELTGIEYSSCCWAVRMVYQEGVDWQQGRDHGFYMQFMLRGLGGFGKSIDQVLRKSIFGYGENEEGIGIVY